jgi:hypothetical protein
MVWHQFLRRVMKKYRKRNKETAYFGMKKMFLWDHF